MVDAALHPFDAGLALEPGAPGRYRGQTSPAYWNMVGPFGGISAAIALRAVLDHPALLGEPVSLTVNYAAALAAGAFEVQARAVRTNRSTQHWLVEVTQAPAAGGDPEVVLTATVLTAQRRDTWSLSDVPMPVVPSPAETPQLHNRIPVEWLQRYEVRPIGPWLPRAWDGVVQQDADPATASTSSLWMRDDPPRPLDFCALAAMCDVFFPRVWLRRPRHVPAGTVSFTVYFHASDAILRRHGTAHLLGQARGQAFYNGFFDQSAWLWNPDGRLLATSTQVVYYKE